MSLVLLAVTLTACDSGAVQARKIIDVHVHAEPEDDPRFGGTETIPMTGEVFTASANAAAHIDETFAVMRNLNVVKAVVSTAPHDLTLSWYERDAGKILVGYGVDDPADIDAAYLRREHVAGRLHVLGEVGAQYEGIPPDDARMEPIYSLAEELDVPVALHMHPGPPGAAYPPFGMTKMRLASGNPVLLEEVLLRHPKMRIYIMHAGWPFLDEMIGVLYAHPQVSVDVGAIAWSLPEAEFHRYLRGLVEAGQSRRIMFGSDQMVWPATMEQAVRHVESARFLSEDQKQDIFCRNAVRFLRLEERTCD